MLAVTTTRAPAVFASVGSSKVLSAKQPRWLTPNCSSKPCLVRVSGGRITPALLMSASMRGSCAASSAAARALARSAWSSGRKATSAPGVRPADPRHRSLGLRLVAAGEQHPRAARRQHARCFEADACVGAGDDEALARLIGRHRLP